MVVGGLHALSLAVMARVRVRAQAIRGDRAIFDAAETRHLVRVLRLRAGDVVHAFDGDGLELTVRLTAVDPRGAAGIVIERFRAGCESPLRLTLVQGVPKGEKMDGILRMATELGVEAIAPLLVARTVVRLDAAGWTARRARWQRVAKESAKQCGRAVVPTVEEPRSLSDWLSARSPGLLVCLWEGDRRAVVEALPAGPVRTAALVIGPEGGLDEGEVDTLREAGAVVGGLGPRILRSETAGPVGLALLQVRYGDLGGPAGC